MSKSSNQSLASGDSASSNKRFSLAGSFQSVKRAVTGIGSKKPAETDKKPADNTDTNAKAADGFAATNPFSDPPPAYTPTASTVGAEDAAGQTKEKSEPTPLTPSARVPSIYTRLRGPSNGTPEADKFRFLAEFDTVFLIDDSSSMNWNDTGHTRLQAGEVSRWEQTRNVIEQIVPICMRYDQDGVDIYFLNDPYANNMFGEEEERRNEPGWRAEGVAAEGKATHVYAGITNADDVRGIFGSRRPALGTPTGKRLGQIMKTYVDCYEARARNGQSPPRPLNIIVITDGEAGDNETLRNNLIAQAMRLDTVDAPYHQLGVQFIQVGRDREAAFFLRDLDDNLGKRGKELRDIVDCVTYEQLAGEGAQVQQLTADVVLKIVLGAVNKRLDNLLVRHGMLVAP